MAAKERTWRSVELNIQKLIEKLRCHDHQTYMTRAHGEEGKAGRMLARLVQKEDRGNPITSVILKDGTIGHSQKSINKAFTDYYKELYGSPRQLAEEVYEGYLDRIQLAWGSHHTGSVRTGN